MKMSQMHADIMNSVGQMKFWEGLWDVIIEYTDRFTLADLMKNEDIENPICKEG